MEDLSQENRCVIKQGFKFGEALRKEGNTPAIEPQELRKSEEGSAANSAVGQGGEGMERGLGPPGAAPFQCTEHRAAQARVRQTLQRTVEERALESTMRFIHELTKLLLLPQ